MTKKKELTPDQLEKQALHAELIELNLEVREVRVALNRTPEQQCIRGVPLINGHVPEWHQAIRWHYRKQCRVQLDRIAAIENRLDELYHLDPTHVELDEDEETQPKKTSARTQTGAKASSSFKVEMKLEELNTEIRKLKARRMSPANIKRRQAAVRGMVEQIELMSNRVLIRQLDGTYAFQ